MAEQCSGSYQEQYYQGQHTGYDPSSPTPGQEAPYGTWAETNVRVSCLLRRNAVSDLNCLALRTPTIQDTKDIRTPEICFSDRFVNDRCLQSHSIVF